MHTRVDRNIELCGIFTIQFSELKSKKYNISFFHPDIRKAEWKFHSAFSYAFGRRFAAQQRGRCQRDEQERGAQEPRRAEPFFQEQEGKESCHHRTQALEQRDRAR